LLIVNTAKLQEVRSKIETIRDRRKLPPPVGPLFPSDSQDTSIGKQKSPQPPPPARDPSLEFNLEISIQKFKELIPLNKDKVWITLCDIEEAIQVQPYAFTIEIPLFFRRHTKLINNNALTGVYRRDALTFLGSIGNN